MQEMPSRREELIGAALTGDLSETEKREFDQAQAQASDPSISAELAKLRATAARLAAADVSWQEQAPPAGLEERIRRVISESDRDSTGENGQSRS